MRLTETSFLFTVVRLHSHSLFSTIFFRAIDQPVIGPNKAPLGTRIMRGVVSSFGIGILSNGFLFAGQLLIPRLLSRVEYAQYTVSISFVAMIALLADLGMNPYFTRLFAEAEEHAKSGLEDRRGLLLGSALALRLGMSVVVAVLVLVLGHQLYSESMVANMSILLLTLIISSRILIVRSVGESVLRSEGKYYLVAAFALVDAAAFAALLFATRSHSLTLTNVLWIYSLCNLPGFVLLSITLVLWVKRNRLRISVDFVLIRTMVRSAFPLTLGTAFLTIHSQIDNLLLDKLSTPLEVSSYGATVRLLSAVAPISMVLAAVTAPELTRLLHHGDTRRARQLTDLSLRALFVVASGIAMILTAASSDLVRILLGGKYASSGPLLVWTGWMALPIFAASFLTEASVAAGKFWISTVYAAVIMVVVVAGDLVMIPSFGAAGAMASKLIALSVGCVTLVFLSRNSNHLNIRDITTAFVRTGIAVGLSFLAIWALPDQMMSNWYRALAVFAVFILAVHFTRLLSLREVTALLKRVRIPSSPV